MLFLKTSSLLSDLSIACRLLLASMCMAYLASFFYFQYFCVHYRYVCYRQHSFVFFKASLKILVLDDWVHLYWWNCYFMYLRPIILLFLSFVPFSSFMPSFEWIKFLIYYYSIFLLLFICLCLFYCSFSVCLRDYHIYTGLTRIYYELILFIISWKIEECRTVCLVIFCAIATYFNSTYTVHFIR